MTAPSATAARDASARANAVSRFWHSSIGKKAVMAVTGLAMIAFLISHVLGNLQVFAGPLKINEYSAALRRLGPLLWIARGGLIVALVLHDPSCVRPQGRVRQRRRGLSDLVGLVAVRPGDGRPGPAPLPRHVEQHP